MTAIKIASTAYVDAKANALQNALDTHTHTVNGNTEVDVSNFYTKEEIDAKIDEAINEAMNEMIRKRPTNSQGVN